MAFLEGRRLAEVFWSKEQEESRLGHRRRMKLKKEDKDSRRDQRYPQLRPDPFHLLPRRAQETFLERSEPSSLLAWPLESPSFLSPNFLAPLTDA